MTRQACCQQQVPSKLTLTIDSMEAVQFIMTAQQYALMLKWIAGCQPPRESEVIQLRFCSVASYNCALQPQYEEQAVHIPAIRDTRR